VRLLQVEQMANCPPSLLLLALLLALLGLQPHPQRGMLACVGASAAAHPAGAGLAGWNVTCRLRCPTGALRVVTA